MHEKLENEKMTPISEVDEILFDLNENLNSIMLKNVPTFLREHVNQKDYVLIKLLENNFNFFVERSRLRARRIASCSLCQLP